MRHSGMRTTEVQTLASITSSQNPAPRDKQDRRNNSYSKEHDSVGEVRERARGERSERETTARDEKARTIFLVDFLHDRICVLEVARACEEVRGHDVACSLESARDVETFIDRHAGEAACRCLRGGRRMVERDERRIEIGERGAVSAGKVRRNPLAAPAPKRRLGVILAAHAKRESELDIVAALLVGENCGCDQSSGGNTQRRKAAPAPANKVHRPGQD